jgi:hypothetical protein
MKENRKEKRSTFLFDSTNNCGRNGEEIKIPITTNTIKLIQYNK